MGWLIVYLIGFLVTFLYFIRKTSQRDWFVSFVASGLWPLVWVMVVVTGWMYAMKAVSTKEER